MPKGVIRFIFDYVAGCIWAGDDRIRDLFGVGPADSDLPLSEPVRDQIERILFAQSCYLSPRYPPDPSLWSQSFCECFNADVDSLILNLLQEIGEDYDILAALLRISASGGIHARNPVD